MRRTTWGLAVFCSVVVVVGCSSTDNGRDAGAAGATSSSDADLCSKQYDALTAKCPLSNDSKDANVQACIADQRDYAGIGCRSQFDAWLACTTKPAYDCENDTGCETPQAGYFSCRSQATVRTGCVRLAAQDATRCTDTGKPYAFSCLGAAPAQCVQVVTEGAGIWCCPQL